MIHKYIDKIICADSYKFLKLLPSKSIDCVITDPPYEIDVKGGTSPKSGLYRNIHRGSLDDLSNGFDYSIFEEMIRVCKIVNLQIFCSNSQVAEIMLYFKKKGYSVTQMIYHKNNPVPFSSNTLLSDIECIVYVRGKGATFNRLAYKEMSKVISANVVSGKSRLHRCQKPEIVIERLVKLFTNKGDVILDCFFGSGTTGVVAKKLGRKFIGVEKNASDCKIAQKRINEV